MQIGQSRKRNFKTTWFNYLGCLSSLLASILTFLGQTALDKYLLNTGVASPERPPGAHWNPLKATLVVPEPSARRRRRTQKGPRPRSPLPPPLAASPEGEAPEELRLRRIRSTWVEALPGCDNARDTPPPSVHLKQGRRDLQRIPPRAAPASADWPDELTHENQESETPEPTRGVSGCAPRARASYGTLKRRARGHPRATARKHFREGRRANGHTQLPTSVTAPLGLGSS